MKHDTPDILKKIVARKHQELELRQSQCSLAEIKSKALDADAPRGFVKQLQAKVAQGDAAVIAEIKKASPSKGVLRENFHPAQIASDYQRGGAACLSVLTDADFFQGHEDYLVAARAACHLPVLRKDFTIDPWQLYEARSLGADCILLIAACLDDVQLSELHALALDLGMDALVEVHDLEELHRAQAMDAAFVGVNNRDLRTFNVSLETSLTLNSEHAYDIVTESGISTQDDVAMMRSAGIHQFLVGEAFMRQVSPGDALRELFT